MTTISQLQRKLHAFNTYAKQSGRTADALQTKWKSIFGEPLSSTSANTFLQYYRAMRTTTRKQKGGNAPLTYQMTPGANISVYGRFPVEVDTDMGSIRDLDVYYQNALTTGCGTENSSLTVPVEMGSNHIGGKSRTSRTSRTSRRRVQQRKTLRSARSARKTRRTRRLRGGDLSDYRPYWASVPPNLLQNISHKIDGVPPLPSPNPIEPAWAYVTQGPATVTNPTSMVTNIKSDLSMLANPAPWQKV